MKDETPQYIPKWISELSNNDWSELISCFYGAVKVKRCQLSCGADWRLSGCSPNYKVKIDLILENTDTPAQLVLKGSQNPNEAVFYKAAQSLKNDFLPTVFKTWVQNAPDGLSWVLMAYNTPCLKHASQFENMMRSQAKIHSSFMQYDELLKMLNWEDSIIFPFTSESTLSKAVKSIPHLFAETHIDIEYSLLMDRLSHFLDNSSGWVSQLYGVGRTVIHCDYYPGNYLVTSEDGSGLVIDWEGVCVNVPFFDIWRTVDYLAKSYGAEPEDICLAYFQEADESITQLGWELFISFLLVASIITKIIRTSRFLEHYLKNDFHNWSLRLPYWKNRRELCNLINGDVALVKKQLEMLNAKTIGLKLLFVA